LGLPIWLVGKALVYIITNSIKRGLLKVFLNIPQKGRVKVTVVSLRPGEIGLNKKVVELRKEVSI